MDVNLSRRGTLADGADLFGDPRNPTFDHISVFKSIGR
jgi:hypothetical protein